MRLKNYCSGEIVIRDTTLREGLDMPGMDRRLDNAARRVIADKIYRLGIREFDIIHPGRVDAQALLLARQLKRRYGKKITVHGAAYALNDRLEQQLVCMEGCADEIDLVMPVTAMREPFAKNRKISCLVKALARAGGSGARLNVGFANASQTEMAFLLEISRKAAAAGAEKVILYDSIGSLDPLETYEMVLRVRAASGAKVLYHCHNDIGLASANSLFAAYAGAGYVDATVNGIGDRAGNASLEQLAMILHLKGIRTGIDLKMLREVSDLVEERTGMAKAANSPVVGDPRVIFAHVSPKHKKCTKAFEAYAPSLLGRR
jgi:isopropylmalate/homocitrate/citramalate synthase